MENSSVSGPLTYFGWPSPRIRPPKLMARPRRSRIGNITRLKNMSDRPRPASSVARLHQPGGDQLGRLIPSRLQLGGQRAPALPGPAEAEAGDGLLGQAAAGGDSRAPRVPRAGTAGGDRRPRPRRARRAGRAPASPAPPPAGVGFGTSSPASAARRSTASGKEAPSRLHEEADGVAMRAAAEAVEVVVL